ncbi:hypothetical protein ACLGIH_18895 [Streptomyces sp. HMX87]|uniref:hypothetical protein n=1 Tax=Streptomyces sp. HMX87 TaxID=3390849 RepID=UPI003A8A0BFF
MGAFRAIAHLCAGMPVRTGTARAAVRAAAVTARPGGHRRRPAARRRGRPAERPRLRPGARRHGVHLRVRGAPAAGTRPVSTPHAPESLRRVKRLPRGISCPPTADHPPHRGCLRLCAVSPGGLRRVSPIVARRYHGALMRGCVLHVTRHGPESAPGSGTLWWMRVVPSANRAGVAPGAAPEPAVRTAARRAERPSAAACSTPRNERRTVCRTGTPSRWNMPEALVGVTVRQPCCPTRDSRSVIPTPAVVLAMQKMATIVALMRCEPLCPPVRMV